MSSPSIIIHGAGIAGLVLAQSLLRRGISFHLYESASRDVFDKRHDYGIDLLPLAFRKLGDLMKIERSAFVKRVAVNWECEGDGCLEALDSSHLLRVNRNKLEQLLAQDLPDSVLRFNSENGETTDTPTIGDEIVVAADGVHSSVRKRLLPHSIPAIQPFTVFRGSKRVDSNSFDQDFAPYFKSQTRLERQLGNELLRIDLTGSLRQSKYMGITYTYSRPVRDENDPLFKPDRATWDATQLGMKFKGVVEEIRSHTKLDGAFEKIFNVERIDRDGDRLLHWLMRSILVDKAELKKVAREQKVLFIGDAAHHQPILASRGANLAVEDALDLAEFLDSGKMTHRLDELTLEDYYDPRFDVWTQDRREAQSRIEQLHGGAASSGGSL
ncbi:Hypothetical protein R9X50_00533000 [Acrodontium crateriforme]|uniref:FAD-binding domain-containing protein n=1 Tax=Acrodontium crateriforme TaxID=150365 RepID=A0AAQ3R5U4_9PEZI|nr:Hypothetical protein R9X50_00533000 [Acrodontium crateriforme]